MESTNPQLQTLCKACGLCCSGHLFSWVRLNASELDVIEKLGIAVIRDDPRQRGFLQPCPMWEGTCRIYTFPEYPKSCARYKCKVFRRLEEGDVSLQEGLAVIEETLALIRGIEASLPDSPAVSFRERLLARKEGLESAGKGLENEFPAKTAVLLARYEDMFGVDDFVDYEA
ncbi:hypothetical protein FBQ83_12875 [Chloroflexi bacterium CFX5]|nr:hypothetical protein [Chloroflexi bacterium CFX5]NUQ59574.1 hypothetical protein [Anaerolineales bacterium]